MIYFIIFLSLIVLSLIQSVTKKRYNLILGFFTLILFLLNSLRFGVGSDYFNYLYIYNQIPKIGEGILKNDNIHGELGFKFSISLAKYFGISYSGYLFFMSLIIFITLFMFLIKYSKNSLMALTIFYSMYYFTYYNSGFRQGLTLILFLSVLLPLLMNGKNLLYCILTVIFSLFHTGILICLILPLIKFDWKSTLMKWLIILSIGFSSISIISNKNLIVIIYKILGLHTNYEIIDISYFAILSRIIMIIFVIFLLKMNETKLTRVENKILTIYFVGFCLYLIFSTQALVASRLHVYFKILEILIIPNLIDKLSIPKRTISSIIILFILIPIFYVKEIKGQISDAMLVGVEKVWDYPYTTIFDKQKIYYYREVPVHIQKYLK